jgi:hypothetical protein
MNEEKSKKLTKTFTALMASLLGAFLFLSLVIIIASAIIIKLVP